MRVRNLCLIPARLGPFGWPAAFLPSHNRLRLDPDRTLFDALGHDGANPKARLFPLRPLPANVSVVVDTADGALTVDRDRYGVRLTWVTAQEAAVAMRAAAELGRGPEPSDWNAAVLGFCDALPPDTPLVLMWE